jgi:hypothetical protein
MTRELLNSGKAAYAVGSRTTLTSVAAKSVPLNNSSSAAMLSA